MARSTDPHMPHPADAGLHCPRCDYNLTGLTRPRCPECGHEFTWDKLRHGVPRRQWIPFERARGWSKVIALPLTAIEVLFLPWIFARQAARRLSPSHAAIFSVVCFATTLLALLMNCSWDFWVAWVLTALIYFPIQTLTLTIVDVGGWLTPRDGRHVHGFLHTLLFWTLITGYTSAVMMTEIVEGPPIVGLTELLDLLRGQLPPDSLTRSLFDYNWDPGTSVVRAQMLLWLLGLACCYAARIQRHGWPLWFRIAGAAVVFVGVLFLYATVIEFIGVPIAKWSFEHL